MRHLGKIARNYAQALYELAISLGLEETFFNEIKVVNELIFQIKDITLVFENPGVSKNEKKDLVKKLFSGKINPTVLNFLFLLIDKRRINLLPEIQNEFNNLVNKAKGIIVAEVESAIKIDNGMLENLKRRLETVLSLGAKVTIESKVDPGLIGGLRVKINDLVYDGSIKGRLENIKRILL